MPFCTIDHASCTIAPRICTIERRCPQPSLPRRSPARPKRCMFALDVRPSSRPRLSRCIPPACLPQSIAYLPHTLVNITMLALQPETHGRDPRRMEDVPLEINHVQACCRALYTLCSPLSSLTYTGSTPPPIAKISNHSFPLDHHMRETSWLSMSELHTQRPLARAGQVPAPPPQDQVHPSGQAVRDLLRDGQCRRRVPAVDQHGPVLDDLRVLTGDRRRDC